MPFGRGWFGWGGMGRGMGFGRGMGWGMGFGRGMGWGMGRGNPYPFCRNFPWLPRWWWATPNAGQYAATIPYGGYSYPYQGSGASDPTAPPGDYGPYPSYGAPAPYP